MNLSNLFNKNYNNYEREDINNKNYNSEELTQGLKYLNRRKKFQRALNKNVKEEMNNSILEGFTTNNDNDYYKNREVWTHGVKGKNTIDQEVYNELQIIKSIKEKYTIALNNYKSAYNTYINELSKYYSSEKGSINQYFGKLVQDPNTNSKYYITLNGQRRWFSANSYTNCHESVSSLKPGLIILPEGINSYKFTIGKHMTEGEPCGYEGMNIQVDRSTGNSQLISRINKGTTISQSSTYQNINASKAIDGSVETYNQTQKGIGEYLELNFSISKLITSISITNRTDCCKERLTDFYVKLYDENKNEIYNKHFIYTDGSKINVFNINNINVEAQYMKIIQNKNEYLHVSLIDVYGKELLKGDDIIGKIAYVPGDGSIRLYKDQSIYNNRNKDCGSNVVKVGMNIWKGFVLGKPMTKTTTCNVLTFNPELKNKVVQYNTDLINISLLLNDKINYVKDKIKLLAGKSNIEEKYKTQQLKEYGDLYNSLLKMTHKDSTLSAMVEDSKIKNSISNYKFMLWLIGTLLLGLYSIKKLRQNN